MIRSDSRHRVASAALRDAVVLVALHARQGDAARVADDVLGGLRVDAAHNGCEDCRFRKCRIGLQNQRKSYLNSMNGRKYRHRTQETKREEGGERGTGAAFTLEMRGYAPAFWEFSAGAQI